MKAGRAQQRTRYGAPSSGISHLYPVRDHEHIVHRLVCYEFPFDMTRSLEFALYRTYCVPSIGRLLDRTGEFPERPQKRYDDTDLMVSELMEWGYTSERGQAALARINAIHGHFSIANEDFLYVLSTFIFEPIRWNARYGWRRMTETERLALFCFWREVGARMGIREIPSDYAALEQHNRAFEERYFRYSDASRRVGEATRDLFASWFPRPFRPLVRCAIESLLDEPTRRAFGFPDPPGWLRRLVPAALRARGHLAGYLPPRRRPRLRTRLRHRSYPQGYTLEKLGPPWFTATGKTHANTDARHELWRFEPPGHNPKRGHRVDR